jgi:hydroxymethylpyrimidine pyrophosphatase-like HAD family hydrolase
MARPSIRLFLADVDGTLVTQDKVLTDRAIAAVKQLKQAGILFAITSGRPPRGMTMLIEPLELTTPIAAFNGGVFARPDMSVIKQQVIPDEVTPTVIELLGAHGLDVWVYRGADWFVRDPHAPHVARETWTVKFDPTPIGSFASVSDHVAKVVGVSDDYDAVQRAVDAVRERFGDHVSAAKSQPYYGDVTHPDANKGCVARTSHGPTRSPPRRSPRSVTPPTTCSCLPSPDSASPWATRAPRSSGPPAGSRHLTRTRASPTRWSGSSCPETALKLP